MKWQLGIFALLLCALAITAVHFGSDGRDSDAPPEAAVAVTETASVSPGGRSVPTRPGLERPGIGQAGDPTSASSADDSDESDGEWDESYPELTADDIMDPKRLAELRRAGKVAKAGGNVLRRLKGVPGHVLTHYDAARWPRDARFFDADQINDLTASTLTRDLRDCHASLVSRLDNTPSCSLKVFVHAIADGEIGTVREIAFGTWPAELDDEYRQCLQAAYTNATYPTLMKYDIWFLSMPCF